MRRLLLALAILVVVTAVVAPAALVWAALFTSGGLQFVIRHIPQQLGPVRLTITGVGGTVARGLTVERVEIEHELVHLTLTGIEGRVALRPLVLQTIRVAHGKVQNAHIEVKRRTKPSTPGPTNFLPAWLIINCEDAQLGSVKLTVYNGFHLEADDVRAAAVIRHSYIRFFSAEGRLEDAHVNALGTLRATDPLGMEVKAHLDWTPAGQPPWTVAGSARGDLDALNIVAHVTNPFRADLTGQALDLTSHWHWVADALVQSFDLRAFGVNSPLGSITGHVAGSGADSGFSVHGPVNPTGLRAGVFEVQFNGNYAAHVLSAQRMEARHLASGARVGASGTIGIVDHGPRLDLNGEWSDFRWPLAGRDVALRSPAGVFALSGLMPYQVHLSGRGRAAELPEMALEASGTLGKDGLTFDPAEVDLFDGHASVSGSIVWSPLQSWSVNGRATNVNPGVLRSDLPGSLSFAFAVSARGFDARSDLTASFNDISGRLRGLAAGGGGTLTHAGTTWGFSNLRVGLGTASLALDGKVGERVDVRFATSVRDLSLLAPGAQGDLKASGTVRGTLAEPDIVATAHGSDFAWQGVTLKAFDADVNFNPGAAAQESRIDARLRQLTFAGRTLETVVLTLNGPPSAYDVHFAATAAGLALGAQAIGPYAHGVFSGQLTALSVTGSEQLRLSLERPVDMSVGLEHARVEWLCLVGTPGSVCADGEWTAANWSATLSANQLPLATLTAGMTPAVEYAGTLSAYVQLAGGAAKPLQGMLTAQLANAEILHRLVSHKVEHTRIGSGTVQLTATPTLISARANLGDSAVGTLRGTLELQREPQSRWQDMPLTGTLHAQTDEANLVTLYVPDIDRCSGHLAADVQLAGTAGSPRLTGLIKVTDGEIDVYQINLSLRQLAMQAQLGETAVDFKGSARAGKGEVSANGHLQWRHLLPYGKFHLEGANLRVADLPEAQIDASPALDFDVNGHKIEVTGRVTIPYAKIQPKDITGAVRASPDEVIVGSEPEDVNERFEVLSTITLALGDHVNVDALGLTARLVGSVTIRSGYDAVTRGNGELSVAEGKYSAYARQLDIQRGRLIFTGGPITNPGIDVVAQKVYPDVTAGVIVRGTLAQPHISFFSDPPLPQQQVASLILAGGSLESAQNASNAALGQGAALLAAQLGSHVGIPDVSLETDPLVNETSLVLGRYLSPRLYVSYGVSLTQQLNTLKMRYTLGDHWTIRTEVGQAYGADLVYSITK
ncbi:MAG TPA: translocation/assembly module TamB domain-containing protein [Steroidobacteraceae bacterium]|jgi:translocation and assembly module TamB|nr:translocation/assembly module TamB domain-containing protein [Steroidobacteraceae bacterium]